MIATASPKANPAMPDDTTEPATDTSGMTANAATVKITYLDSNGNPLSAYHEFPLSL